MIFNIYRATSTFPGETRENILGIEMLFKSTLNPNKKENYKFGN